MTDLIEVKEQTFLKNYKDIVKTCLDDGYLMPSLLTCIDVPSKYDFTEDEINKMRVSEESSSRRQDMMMDLEIKMSEVDNTDMDMFAEEMTIIWNEELMAFIANYPQYQKILK